MNIGQAAHKAGISAKMIRHYESKGLLRKASRSQGGYRTFSAQDIEILKFIRRARLLGFSLEQIGDLLRLWQDPARTSQAVKALATQHLAEVETKMHELSLMKQTLEQMISHCLGDQQAECAILDQLATGD